MLRPAGRLARRPVGAGPPGRPARPPASSASRAPATRGSTGAAPASILGRMTYAVVLVTVPSLLESLGRGVLALVAYSIVGTLLLLLGYFVVDVLTPRKLRSIIRTEPN